MDVKNEKHDCFVSKFFQKNVLHSLEMKSGFKVKLT